MMSWSLTKSTKAYYQVKKGVKIFTIRTGIFVAYIPVIVDVRTYQEKGVTKTYKKKWMSLFLVMSKKKSWLPSSGIEIFLWTLYWKWRKHFYSLTRYFVNTYSSLIYDSLSTLQQFLLYKELSLHGLSFNINE